MKKYLLICAMAAGLTACCQATQREEYKTTYEYVPVYEQVPTCTCCKKACPCKKAKPAPKKEKKPCGCCCTQTVTTQPKTQTMWVVMPQQQRIEPIQPVVHQEIVYPQPQPKTDCGCGK